MGGSQAVDPGGGQPRRPAASAAGPEGPAGACLRGTVLARCSMAPWTSPETGLAWPYMTPTPSASGRITPLKYPRVCLEYLEVVKGFARPAGPAVPTVAAQDANRLRVTAQPCPRAAARGGARPSGRIQAEAGANRPAGAGCLLGCGSWLGNECGARATPSPGKRLACGGYGCARFRRAASIFASAHRRRDAAPGRCCRQLPRKAARPAGGSAWIAAA
jgi:hypothetical protein